MIRGMNLSPSWRFVLLFAVIGLSIATATALCIVLHAPNIVVNLLLLISPGIWFFGPHAWSNPVAMWFMFLSVAIANGVVYATVGAAIAALRWMLKHKDATK
jgi:hypothetical protein